MKLLRRNLSLMLAVRYLNPLRTMFSIITLICLGGVALGVMVLIVVLSVMEGLQKEIEDKALAFAPHYVISLTMPVNGYLQRTDIAESVCDWKGVIEKIKEDEEVESVYPRMEGDAFAQSDRGRMTIRFSSLQPGNAPQIAPVQEMIKSGTADFGAGLDEECVISYETAENLGLDVGDTVHVTPVGNLDEVADIYSMIQKPLRTHENTEFMEAVGTLFAGVAEDSQEAVAADPEKIAKILDIMGTFSVKDLRMGELEVCDTLNELLYMHADGSPFPVEERKRWQTAAETLKNLDRDKEDGRAVKSINQMTMPIDLRIVGIYQAPENIGGPNIYMPLAIAQNVLGLSDKGDEKIMGICIRVKDIHKQTDIQQRLYAMLPNPKAPAPAAPTEEGDDAPPPLEDVEMPAEDAPADVAEVAPETPETPETPAAPAAEDPAAAVAEAVANAPTEAVQPPPATDTTAATADTGAEQAAGMLDAMTDANGMWYITPWTESFEKWSKIIANERTMMSFVLSIISLIASFCIMAVMFTMSIQRKREIAVLQALGATPSKIMGIFAWQGVLIGFVGSLLGVGLALLVLYYRLEIQAALASIGMDPFPMQAHGITLPANYDPVTFSQQAITAFIMVVIAAIIPAFIVSRQDPAKALRSN